MLVNVRCYQQRVETINKSEAAVTLTYSSLEQEVIKMSADQAALSKLIESLSQNDQGSTAQQALSNLLGVEVPLDTGVEGAAGLIAEKLGLNQKSTLAQTGMYVVTKAAILEGAALIGIGGGIAKLDNGHDWLPVGQAAAASRSHQLEA